MKRVLGIAVAVLGVGAAALMVPALQGCGCHEMRCLCSDGHEVVDTCTTGTQDFRCPYLCTSNAGWSGSCSGANDCRGQSLVPLPDGGMDSRCPASWGAARSACGTPPLQCDSVGTECWYVGAGDALPDGGFANALLRCSAGASGADAGAWKCSQ